MGCRAQRGVRFHQKVHRPRLLSVVDPAARYEGAQRKEARGEERYQQAELSISKPHVISCIPNSTFSRRDTRRERIGKVGARKTVETGLARPFEINSSNLKHEFVPSSSMLPSPRSNSHPSEFSNQNPGKTRMQGSGQVDVCACIDPGSQVWEMARGSNGNILPGDPGFGPLVSGL
jgi:hypothetical protein